MFRAVAKLFQNAPERRETHPTHEHRVQWYGSGAFVEKNSNKTSWHELLHCQAQLPRKGTEAGEEGKEAGPTEPARVGAGRGLRGGLRCPPQSDQVLNLGRLRG